MASLKRVSGFQQPPLSPPSGGVAADSRGEEDEDEEDKDEKSASKEVGAAAKTVFIEDASENAKQWMMAGLPPLPTTDKEVKKELNKLMRQESFTTSATTENKKTNVSRQQEVSKQTQNYYYSSDSDVPQNATNTTMNKFNNKQTSALTSNLRRVDSTLLANTVMCRPEDDPDARLEESSTTAKDGKTQTTMKKLTPEDFEALYLVANARSGKCFK